ncbi:MAG: enoyl-CoA hydratase-related protein [Thermodesulfobacteriota bacterium]
MDFKTIMFSEPEPGIGLVVLNRPERLNAINLDMLEEMHELYERLCLLNRVRVIILTGEGRGFCSGADLLDERMRNEAPILFADAASFLLGVQKKFSNLILEMRRLPQPIVAAVRGPAAGGGMSLALASDVVIAAPSSKFIASFINLGLSGGELGTTWFLPRRIGLARASEILMTGRPIEAAEAERTGLINRLVEDEALLETAFQTARMMLTKSPMGLRQTKEALNQNLTAPSLEAAIELENRNQSICAFTAEFKAAIEAFVKGKQG